MAHSMMVHPMLPLYAQRCPLRPFDSPRLIYIESAEIPVVEDEPSRAEATGLLSLPDEILLQIFDLIHGELFSLATLSRRLHHIALPIYLARCGIPRENLESHGELTLAGHRLDLIPLLHAALYIHSLRHVSYSFRSVELAFERVILKDIRRLDSFLDNLDFLEEVTLDFTNVNWYLWSYDQSHRGWSTHLGFLLDTIISKSCKKLTLLRGTPVDNQIRRLPSRDEQVRPRATSGGSRFPSLKKVVAQKVCRRTAATAHGLSAHDVQAILDKYRRIRLSQGARQRTKLKEFVLHSPLFFVYPCFSWTMDVLSSSPITRLSLGPMGICHSSWASILADISLPLLNDFSVDSCAIAPADLVNFLSRHPAITELHLDRVLRLPDDSQPIPVPTNFLPRLMSIAADPEGLISFFTLSGSNRKLRNIRILSRIVSGDQFNPIRLSGSLKPIIPFLGNSTLCLRIYLEPGSLEWLSCLVDGDFEVLDISPLPTIRRVDFVSEFVYSTTPPKWLEMFPRLEVASFTKCTEALMNVAQFNRLVKAQCPFIRKVEINGSSYSLRDRVGRMSS